MKRRFWLGCGLLMAWMCSLYITGTAGAAELPVASEPRFADADATKGKLYGSLEFKPAPDQSGITDYAIYFLDAGKAKLEHLGDVNIKKAEEGIAYLKSIGLNMNKGYYSFSIAKDTLIPKGAEYFGIYAKNAAGESDKGVTLFIWDSPVDIVREGSFNDTNPSRGKVEGVLRWKVAPNHPEVAGFSVKYFDGTSHRLLPEPYGIVRAGQTEYEIPIAPGTLPAMASSFYVQPLQDLNSGDAGMGGSARIQDNISNETAGIPARSSGLPVPTDVKFTDKDKSPGIIGGEVSWKSEDDEFIRKDYSSGGTQFVYSLYFLDRNDRKLQGIGSIPRNEYEYGNYEFMLPAGLAPPQGAAAIGVFVELAAAEGVVFGKVELRDDTGKDYYAKQVRFVDEDPKAGAIRGKVSWLASEYEDNLQGYALFADEEASPFLRVDKGSKAYQVDLPAQIGASGYKYVRVVPVDRNGQFVRSISFNDGKINLADNKIGGTFEPGKLDGAGPMFGSSMVKDEDPRAGYIDGVLEAWTKDPQGTMEWYFYDYQGVRLASIGSVSYRVKPEGDKVAFVLPANTQIPPGAVYIGHQTTASDGKRSETGVYLYDYVSPTKVKFNDTPAKSEYAVSYLADRGIVNGYDDGTFLPKQTVTRAQFAAMINRAYQLPERNDQGTFADVKADDWFADTVATAVQAELLQGYEDGTFRPNQTITRQEMYAILYRIYLWHGKSFTLSEADKKGLGNSYADWQQTPEWLHSAIYALRWHKLIPDTGSLELSKPVDREECALTMYKVLTQLYW